MPKPPFPNLPCPIRSPRRPCWPLRLLAGLVCMTVLILLREESCR